MNLRQFTRRINLIAGGIPENVERLMRKTALATHQAVTVATPVDTGRARANWIVSKGEPSGATRKVSTKAQGSAALGRTMDAGRSTISSYRLGESLFITNNLPYIQRLNEGWSAQAPARFVERAVAQARQLVANTRVVK